MSSVGIYAWWLVLIALVLLNAIAAAWWLHLSMRVKIVEDAVRRFQADQARAVQVLTDGLPGLKESVGRLRRRPGIVASEPSTHPNDSFGTPDPTPLDHDPRLVEAAHGGAFADQGMGNEIGSIPGPLGKRMAAAQGETARARPRAELVAGSDVTAASEIRAKTSVVQPCRRIPTGQPNTPAGNRCAYPGCTKLEEEPCDGYRAVR